MSAPYKLTYFNGKFLAEPVRLLFAYGDIPFEDVRFEEDEWPQLKNKMPFGVVPTLQYQGKVVGQSHAIGRYVANLVGLTGKDAWENLEVDAMVDTLSDLRLKFVDIYYESDVEKKKQLTAKVKSEVIPYYLTRLDAIAKNNNGYLAIGRLTWADIYFYNLAEVFEYYTEEDPVKNYPNLDALRVKVAAIPAIKKWLETRPVTSW